MLFTYIDRKRIKKRTTLAHDDERDMSGRSILINSERCGEVARMWEGSCVALNSIRNGEDLLKAFRQEVIYLLYTIYFNF